MYSQLLCRQQVFWCQVRLSHSIAELKMELGVVGIKSNKMSLSSPLHDCQSEREKEGETERKRKRGRQTETEMGERERETGETESEICQTALLGTLLITGIHKVFLFIQGPYTNV